MFYNDIAWKREIERSRELQSRVQQLEEALREAQPLVAFHMFSSDGKYQEGERALRIINAALRREQLKRDKEEE